MHSAATTAGARARDPGRRAARAEGLALLRAAHDVDVRVGLPREEFLAILPDYDALLVRSQVQVDAEAIAAGSRLTIIGRAGVGVDNIDLAGRHGGRHHRRQRPDRQHHRGRRAHAGAADGARPADRRGGRVDAPRRVEARRSSRATSCAARRWASSAWARSGWPSPTAPAASRWRSSATTRS